MKNHKLEKCPNPSCIKGYIYHCCPCPICKGTGFVPVSLTKYEQSRILDAEEAGLAFEEMANDQA